VEGEVSNLKAAGSGHWYFSLKDDGAQIRAVVWKTAQRLIRFRPRDGMKVVARGSVRVYPPRGEYQLAIDVLEPLGKGSLQQAFEELKERLQKEGLFDPGRKRPLPLLPRRVGIVTSPTGAVIQDFLRLLTARYANIEVVLYPARVQGAEAAVEIVRGLRSLNRIRSLDVVVLARGGGSLEDLWPFNEESVARAIAASRIPTISAVGHETDFTIADFVADVRAPTPSAAAERVIQAKEEIAARIDGLGRRLGSAMDLRMARVRARLAGLTSHRVFEAERGRIRGQAQQVEGLARRAERGLLGQIERAGFRLRRSSERLEAFRWDRQVEQKRESVRRRLERLEGLASRALAVRRGVLGGLAGKLDGLSPLSVLSRGYALVWDGGGRLVREPGDVEVGDPVRLRVGGGALGATITSKEGA
jgi:exodeoxyribonuclease VII large subunit